jgi:hypothetical protein
MAIFSSLARDDRMRHSEVDTSLDLEASNSITTTESIYVGQLNLTSPPPKLVLIRVPIGWGVGAVIAMDTYRMCTL